MATGTDKNKSDEKPTAEAVASEKPIDQPSTDAQTFALSRLLTSDAEALVGHPAYVVAGAFHGVPDNTEITIKDAKARIRDWLKAPIKSEEG
jgi:hypothetical protein